MVVNNELKNNRFKKAQLMDENGTRERAWDRTWEQVCEFDDALDLSVI